jgi:2-oxoisovalerate dehydrogenase E2 component (dihydrolipoyl transacylase)
MATQVVMPQLGESVVEGKVTKWLKREGEQVARNEPLLEVETDKVTTEVTAIEGGTLLKVFVPEGTTVRAGTPLAVIGQPGEPIPAGGPLPTTAHVAPSPPTPSPAVAGEREKAARGEKAGFISPVVARIAAEYNVDLSQVKGTGQGGRITKQDVLAYVEAREKAKAAPPPEKKEALPPWEQPGLGELFRPTEEVFGPAPAPAAPPPTPAPAEAVPPPAEVVPLTSIRQAIAEHMVRSKRTSPHVTTVFEVDMSRVVAHREKYKAAYERDGVKLTYTAYFVKAAVHALKAYPLVNSSWSDQGIVLKRPINIGIAVSLGDEGLIVPVIKGADNLNLLGIARAVNDLAERARNRQLKPDDVQGGTFTITNHGVSGSLFATPIINQPQAAILGVGAVQKRVVVLTHDGVDTIAIRPMVYISLTFDHRILDGASADAFVAKVKEVLENWRDE